MDSSGANVLGHISSEYEHVNIKLFLAGCSADIRRTMVHAETYKKIPEHHIFVELHDAIAVYVQFVSKFSDYTGYLKMRNAMN
jgi:anti-anti-sigma regulatory factor